MQKISIPYYAEIQQIVSHSLLKQATGLMWYHNGQEQRDSEWLSAWPIEEYEYLGQRKIKITDFRMNQEVITADWFEFLKLKMPDVQASVGLKFTGGLAGHLAYDLGLEILNIESSLPGTDLPLASVGSYLWCIYTDHIKQASWIVIQDACPQEIIVKIMQLLSLLKQPEQKIPSPPISLLDIWQCNLSQTDYKKAFNSIKHYIVEGDVYQVNLTRQWRINCADVDDWAIYLRLAGAMPAPFSVFHRTQTHSLLSVSPERFVQISNGSILTQPIKGTRPRSKNEQQDLSYKLALKNSEKDQAENLMIVDLLRNDIAKNALPGSVEVKKLFEVQSFKNVHHLVSSIKATLDPGKHPLDVLRDAFPGGSITGAPKKRAMEIIDELETVRRGNYCGCSFYITANNQLDSSILIRTITLKDGELTCSGGGGIVFDSQCDEEFEESAVKINNILNAFIH